MKVEFLIRKANLRDVDQLVNLLKDLFSKEADFTFDEVKQRRGLEMILDNDESSCIMVAELNGQVIGMSSTQILISTAEGGKAAMIEDVVVKEGHRGSGVGRSLLASVAEWSKAQGALRLALLADENNTSALEFYEVLQWQKTHLICLHKKN